MTIGILGKKLGMTQIFTEKGNVVPVSVIKAGPCLVLQKKTMERDGYDAVQIGLVGKTPKRLRTKPVSGHFNKSKAGNIAFIKEIRGGEMHTYNEGDTVSMDLFAENELVNITGISKGKGFQGVMKRHGFAGLSATHGTHKKHRSPGAVGQCAWPGRTFKGMRMAGRMGGNRKTIQNLEIIQIIPEKNLILIKGAVPGAYKANLIITKKLAPKPESK